MAGARLAAVIEQILSKMRYNGADEALANRWRVTFSTLPRLC